VDSGTAVNDPDVVSRLQPGLINREGSIVAKHNGAFNNVLQLANVSGPIVICKQFERLFCNLVKLLAVAIDQILNEQGNVARSRSAGIWNVVISSS